MEAVLLRGVILSAAKDLPFTLLVCERIQEGWGREPDIHEEALTLIEDIYRSFCAVFYFFWRWLVAYVPMGVALAQCNCAITSSVARLGLVSGVAEYCDSLNYGLLWYDATGLLTWETSVSPLVEETL